MERTKGSLLDRLYEIVLKAAAATSSRETYVTLNNKPYTCEELAGSKVYVSLKNKITLSLSG
jgi:hypothetical protein